MTTPVRLLRAGIDMGGTGTRLILLEGLREVAGLTLPTASFEALPKTQRSGELVNRLQQLCPADGQIVSLGIGASGPVNNRSGVIENDDTLACFSFFPLLDEMQQRLNVPAAIDNDAVVAALGEYHAGAGVGSKRMLMVTLGTGIGVALLDNGHPFRTADDRHPEAGHIPVSGNGQRCYCGVTGCWEQEASRSWLQEALRQVMPALDWPQLTVEVLKEKSATEPRIAALLHEYGERVGRGLSTLLTLYGPDLTVLSGSAAALLPLFSHGLDAALQRAPGYRLPENIMSSSLGDVAGALGAALLPTIRLPHP
ncbi:glucokinase [Chimaeribacter californicus]|uniref:Glucokinase n=1 Tax=Chimaeribacter californicus TaxID=2060067 RepID=A0A2N5E2A0_9GAMM|nr:ROK family protein [Chimaeribacter californicus]PLR34689.1 glucokinase [Chimaeribacter californicus]